MKQHQATIAAVKKGDEVVTGGGIRGRVTKVSDDEAEVEIAQGVEDPSRQVDASPRCSPSSRSRRTTDLLEFPRWKVWLVSLVVAIGVLLSIPA